MIADFFDLGVDPEHTDETEFWRPSADYPEVTTHRFRRVGDRLDVLTTPANGQPHTRSARILTVWRNVQLAEVRFEGADLVEHFDLVSKKLIGRPGKLWLEVPLGRDPIDPDLWVALLTTLATEGPRLYPALTSQSFTREALEATPWSPLPTGRVASVRWPSGYRFTREETKDSARVECDCGTSIEPHLGVVLLRPHDPSRPSRALVVGYFNAGVAAVDAAVARLRALLVG